MIDVPTITIDVPRGTEQLPWNFVFEGINPDGTRYNETLYSDVPSLTPDQLRVLPVGARLTCRVVRCSVPSLATEAFIVQAQPEKAMEVGELNPTVNAAVPDPSKAPCLSGQAESFATPLENDHVGQQQQDQEPAAQ